MKRLQFMIDEDLNSDLERMAFEKHTSKAALIRDFVRQHVPRTPPIERDSIWEMVGVDDYEPADIDEVVYG